MAKRRMTGMIHFRRLFIISLTALLVYIPGFSISRAVETHTESDAVSPSQVETTDEAVDVEVEEIEPEPQRLYCAEQWTKLYEGQKAGIKVTTRGHYNQIAIFSCPDSEYRGKTGLMRLHECGFTQAVFKGMRGTESIVVDVPRVFPDPNRLVCVNDWSKKYQKNYPSIQISSRGELNEAIVFSCLNCPFQKSFIAPFLLTVTDGKTAMERMKECGFTEVVFTNPMGTREVVREVR
jgi:hypothetical protein